MTDAEIVANYIETARNANPRVMSDDDAHTALMALSRLDFALGAWQRAVDECAEYYPESVWPPPGYPVNDGVASHDRFAAEGARVECRHIRRIANAAIAERLDDAWAQYST